MTLASLWRPNDRVEIARTNKSVPVLLSRQIGAGKEGPVWLFRTEDESDDDAALVIKTYKPSKLPTDLAEVCEFGTSVRSVRHVSNDGIRYPVLGLPRR